MVELDARMVFHNLAVSWRWAVHLFEFVNIQLFSKKNESNIFFFVKRDLGSSSRQMSPSWKLEIAFIWTYLTQTFSLSNYGSICV
jgi:hypothetical protein